MKLVEDITELLTSVEPDLENALVKAQVLAHKLDEAELANWVRNELVGYKNDLDIPPYRMLPLTPYGIVSNGVYRHSNTRLPTAGLSREHREKFFTRRLNNSIAVIRDWAKTENLTIVFAPETYGIFKGLERTYSVERAWGVFGEGAMTQVLVEVRSRLLDFILKLSDRLPAEPGPEGIKQLSKEIDVNGLFKGAIFGDGAVLNVAVGANNTATQNVTYHVTKGDFKSLANELKKASVQEPDIQTLNEAIEADGDAEEHSTKNFGPRVRGWLGGMVAKAGTTAWDFSIQTGAGVLATALSKFYGFS